MLAACLSIAVAARGASISGTVTALGAGVGGISVDVFLWDSINSTGEMVGFAMTGADGSYTVSNLAAGNYRLGFRDDSGVYAPVFYSNSLDIGSATSVVVTAAQAASGIDAALVTASSIGGTVTAVDGNAPLESIAIAAFRQVGSNWEFVGGQITDANGVYLITGLAAGSYRLEFNDSLGVYAGEFYNDKASLALADTVNVSVSTSVQNINASLVAASSISGTVTGPGGAPLSGMINVNALAYSSVQGAWITASAGATDASGNYTLNGLSAGTYRVQFVDYSGTYATEYYDDAADVDSATNVVVGAAATTSGINAAMSLAGYNTWVSNYGLDPATNGAASADPDNDGFINGSEYAFGTDPTFSTPSLISSSYASNNPAMTYMEKINGLVSYARQTNSNLIGGAWNDTAIAPVDDPDQAGVPTGYSRKILTIPGSGKLFYRVNASWN